MKATTYVLNTCTFALHCFKGCFYVYCLSQDISLLQCVAVFFPMIHIVYVGVPHFAILLLVHAHSPEDGSEMLAHSSGTIFLFSFKTQCVERHFFLLWILSPTTYFLVLLVHRSFIFCFSDSKPHYGVYQGPCSDRCQQLRVQEQELFKIRKEGAILKREYLRVAQEADESEKVQLACGSFGKLLACVQCLAELGHILFSGFTTVAFIEYHDYYNKVKLTNLHFWLEIELQSIVKCTRNLSDRSEGHDGGE